MLYKNDRIETTGKCGYWQLKQYITPNLLFLKAFKSNFKLF